MKKYIIVLIVIALFSCTNTKTNQENYSYTRISSTSNYSTIVFEDYDDFIKKVGNNREILLIKEDSNEFFGFKDDDEMYLLDSLGYKNLEDYMEGIKLNYRRSKDYYDAQSIGCNNSTDYYRYVDSKFLTFKDYTKAKENGFLSLEKNDTTLFKPLKYPDELHIDNYNKYQSQFNNSQFFTRDDYYIAEDNSYYRFILKYNDYNTHPSFASHPNHFIEDLFYYGRLLNYDQPKQIYQYINKIENNDYIKEKAKATNYTRFSDKNIKSYNLNEVRTRTADENPYTVIIDGRLAVLNKPPVIKLLNDKREDIYKIMRKYFSAKYQVELLPQNEKIIKEEVIALIKNYLDIDYIYDITFLQLNVVEF